MGDRQPSDDGAQQLALARSGRPDDQAVRAHAIGSRLFQVENHQVAVGTLADRDAQERVARPRVPGARGIDLADSEQVEQTYPRRQHNGAAAGLQSKRSEAARDRLAKCQAALVRDAAEPSPAGSGLLHR